MAVSRSVCCVIGREMPPLSPAFASLESRDDSGFPTELRLVRVRAQVAIIRTLADQVEALSRVGDASALAEQIIEEMAGLGCRLLETAAALAGPPAPEDSGFFARRLDRGQGA